MTTATQTTLRQLIRERVALSSEPDPHVIAAELAAQADEDIAREALRAAMVTMVRLVVHEHNRALQRRLAHAPVAGGAAPQWAKDAETWNTIFDRRVNLGEHEFKFLGDLTKKDAIRVALAYRERANDNMTEMRRFKALADRLDDGSVARELGLAVVEEIFRA